MVLWTFAADTWTVPFSYSSVWPNYKLIQFTCRIFEFITWQKQILCVDFGIFLFCLCKFWVCLRTIILDADYLEKMLVVGVIWYVHLVGSATVKNYWRFIQNSILFSLHLLVARKKIEVKRMKFFHCRTTTGIGGHRTHWWICRFNEIIHSFHVNVCNAKNTIYWCNSIRNKWTN